MTKILVDKALIDQALNHLTNLQPKLANGLLTGRQLQFIDPYIDEAMITLRTALEQPAEMPLMTADELGEIFSCFKTAQREVKLARMVEAAVRKKAGIS